MLEVLFAMIFWLVAVLFAMSALSNRDKRDE